MFVRLKRVAVPAVAIGFLSALPIVAKADVIPVTYYTTGTFGSDTASVNGTNHFQSDTVTNTGIALTYANNNPTSGGAGDTSVLLTTNPITGVTFSYADFGNFSWTGAGVDVPFNTSFTLTFYQESPAVVGSNPSVLGSITGNLSVVSGIAGSQLVATFSPTQVYVTPENPSFLYSLRNINPDGTIDIADGGFLEGQITAVPLPATASTGLALLGGLGLMGGVSVLRRRRQMA